MGKAERQHVTSNSAIAERPRCRARATYAVHLRLVGKPIVVFLLVIIKATPTIVGEAFIFYV